MKYRILFIGALLSLPLSFQALSGDEHDHMKEDGKSETAPHKEESEESHAHQEGDDHGHSDGEADEHGEENTAIGPDKGILEKGALGMKLSPEAVQTINPQSISWSGGVTIIPYKALVRIKDAKSIFRLRDGWYKRVPASIVSRSEENVTIQANDLQAGDKIIVSGLGFLRMAEVIAEEGASHGHSH